MFCYVFGAPDRHRTCNIRSLKPQRLPIASLEQIKQDAVVSPGIEPLFQLRCPLARPARLLAAISVCCNHPWTGTPDRIRTGTWQCLRLLPATNWATGAYLALPQGFEPQNVGIKIRCLRPTWRREYIGSSYWDRTSDLHNVNVIFYRWNKELCLVHRERIELSSPVCNTRALPLDERCINLVPSLGFEPRLYDF